MKKTVICIALAVLMIMGALPMTALAATADAASTGMTFNVADAAHLRSALQTEGEITVNVNADIELTLSEPYTTASYDNNKYVYCWASIAQGNKTVNLNGHRVYITDNFVTEAEYKKSGNYYSFEPHRYTKDANMFLIPSGASLMVNGKDSGSEMMIDAQMPSKDQLIDDEIVTRRSLFYVAGGSLTLAGGEYQAGRRKTVWVTSAAKLNEDWDQQRDSLGFAKTYTGNGVYCIGGNVVTARSGLVFVNGGKLIAHGYSSSYPAVRNAGILTVDADVIVYDASVECYCGASAFKKSSGAKGTVKVYSGKAYSDTADHEDSVDVLLWPYGMYTGTGMSKYAALVTHAGYTDASRPADCKMSNTDVINDDYVILAARSLYTPGSKLADALRWEDGGSGEKTVFIDNSQKAAFYIPPYYPTESMAGVSHDYGYYWQIKKVASDGSTQSVHSGWLGSDHDPTFDLANAKSYLVSGQTYELTARMEETWSSTHDYTYKVSSTKSLRFKVMRAADYVVDSVNVTFPAPIAGEKLCTDTSMAKGLPEQCYCKEVLWYRGTSRLRSGSVASPGIEYEVQLILRLNVGKFAHWTTLQNNAKLNGNQAKITAAGSDELYVKYTFPEAEDDRPVLNSAGVTLDEPMTGEKPAVTAQTGDSTYFVKSVEWRYTDSGNKVPADAVFEAGKRYTVRVTVKADGGKFKFTNGQPDTPVTVNGNTARAYSNLESGLDELVIIYDFPEQLKTKISEVAVNGVTAPVAGETPVYHAEVPEGSSYTVEDFNYSPYSAGVAWFYSYGGEMSYSDEFEAGRQYYVMVSLVPVSDSFEFATDGLSGSLNGMTAEAGEFNPSTATENVYVKFTFTCAAPPASGYIVGDVNGSGEVDNRDAMILDRFVAGWDGYEARITNIDAADMDRKGTVDNRDAMILDRVAAGWVGYYEKYCITVTG